MNNKKWTIELKDIKGRQAYAPKQRVFKNKKTYSRKSFKLVTA